MDDFSRALHEDLLRDLECPVWMEYMVPPIKLPQHLQQVQSERPALSYMQSRVFRDQECGSGKLRQKTEVPLR